jgi:hypothetical protein
MTTLIAVYNSEGCVGRCDARCYEAANAKCHCICGGRNHSAGKQRAMENVARRVGLELEDLQAFALERGFSCDAITAVDRISIPKAKSARHEAYMRINQPSLFPPVGSWVIDPLRGV